MSHKEEKEAGWYDDLFSRSSGFDRARPPWLPVWQYIASKIPPNSSVLDFGCGPGHLAAILTARKIKYHGVDFSEAALKKARKRAPKTTFSIGNLPSCVKTEYEKHRPTVVVFSEVLEHIKKDVEAIRL